MLDTNTASLTTLLPLTADLLKPFTPRPRKVPAEFARRDASVPGTLLQFHDWVLPGAGELRCTEIFGPRAQIFNLMIFPNGGASPWIFASEIVVFGGGVRIAVIDIQRPDRVADDLPEAHLLRLQPLRQVLTNVEDLPAWAHAHFTAWSVVHRSSTLEALPAILQAYRTHLDVWCDLQREESSSLPEAEHVADYKSHHASNSPGVPFLSKLFGADWTKQFLHGHMYG
jgi:hypothetical protein